MVDKKDMNEIWKSLYQLADQIKELAPWEWMDETDIFAVQNPENQEFGYVSVMGTLGEHLAVAVYLGSVGFYGLSTLISQENELSSQMVLEIPQLQLSFENRDMLEDEDIAQIKQLNLMYRGKQAWPMFRSYTPACMPWFFKDHEAHFMVNVLEQMLVVAERFRQPLGLRAGIEEGKFLARIPEVVNGELIWKNDTVFVPDPPEYDIDLVMDFDILESLKSITSSDSSVEVDLFLMETPIQEDETTRPYYPYNLLIVEAKKGFVMGSELLSPVPSLQDMWGEMSYHFAVLLANAEILPKEVRVKSDFHATLLEPLAQEIGFKIRIEKKLPMLERVRDELDSFLYD